MTRNEIIRSQQRMGTTPYGFRGTQSIAACEKHLRAMMPAPPMPVSPGRLHPCMPGLFLVTYMLVKTETHWPMVATMPIEVMKRFVSEAAGAFWSWDALRFQATSVCVCDQPFPACAKYLS